MTRLELLSKVKDANNAVELGVRKGNFSYDILKNTNIKKLYSIDRWGGDRGHDSNEIEITKNKLKEFGSRSEIIVSTFNNALKMFPDNFFDFIYIDGYAGICEGETKEDVLKRQGELFESWFGKVNYGGLYAGHDYYDKYPVLVESVNTFVKKHNLNLKTTSNEAATWFVRKGE